MGQSNDDDDEMMERDIITMELEDGETLECMVLEIFPVQGRQYIALLPVNEDGDVDEDAEIYLYRYEELEDDEVSLESIEDDDEFEIVSDAYDELRDAAEFDDLFGDEDDGWDDDEE